MPLLLDITEFCKDLPEIKSKNVITRRKFHSEGILSEQIFGPVKNYTCQCGTYYGSSSGIDKCKLCGVDVVKSIERRRRFARIHLPFKVINPIFYDLVVWLGGKELKRHIDTLLKSDKSALYVDIRTNAYYVSDDHSEKYASSNFKKYEKDEAIFRVVSQMAEDLQDAPSWKFVKDNIDKLLIQDVIVLPPDLRPTSKSTKSDQPSVTDPFNRSYVSILAKTEEMRSTLFDIHRDKRLYYFYFKLVQREIFSIYEYILSKISKKEGLIRKHILGKRIDFSGRAVITPDPLLNFDECCLPYPMVLELFKLQIAKKLIEHERFKFMNNAIEYVDQCSEMSDPSLLSLCEEIVENEACLLNRQPSLHRLSLMGFKIKVGLGNTIKIHPLSCFGFNADFDGDQMAVYLPLSKEAKNEVHEKFLPSVNLFNATNSTLTQIPSQDIILGIYFLTNEMIPDLNIKVMCKDVEITKGMKIFNDCLPDDYPLVNSVIRKNELLEILNDITEKFDKKISVKVLDSIKDAGFKYSTIFGCSLSLENIISPEVKIQRDKIYSKETMKDQVDAISSKEIEDILRKEFKYSYLIDSGARGSWDQARQIILSRGYIANFEGAIITTPIKSSLIEGLTQEEFFLSAYGCRKGLLDVAINTGASGYLSRKLIFTCANLQKDADLEDCGCKEYLPVYVENLKKAQTLLLRWWLNPDTDKEEMITKEVCKDIVGRHIKVRSPIYCLSEKICNKCYGDLWRVCNSRYVGILAAQALGEIGTQLVLRNFHTSGVAQTKGLQTDVHNLRQMDIIGDLSTASALLHIRDKSMSHIDLVNNLYKVYASSKFVHHIHFEVIVAQLMWHGARKWRLYPNRDKVQPMLYSVLTVPEKESWVLGLAFSNPKKNILRGVLQSGFYSGILDTILLGRKI